MTSYTNISQSLNLTTLSDLLKQANTNTGDSFWSGMYFMIIAIVFISSMALGYEVALGLALFAGMIVGIFLVYLGLISVVVFGMSEAILIFIVIYLMYSSRSNP